jgi:hypothetical protein
VYGGRVTTTAEIARALHDRVCMSGCEGGAADDHARRTQTVPARELRASRDPAQLLHDRECLLHLDSSKHCRDRERHAESWVAVVREIGVPV